MHTEETAIVNGRPPAPPVLLLALALLDSRVKLHAPAYLAIDLEIHADSSATIDALAVPAVFGDQFVEELPQLGTASLKHGAAHPPLASVHCIAASRSPGRYEPERSIRI